MLFPTRRLITTTLIIISHTINPIITHIMRIPSRRCHFRLGSDADFMAAEISMVVAGFMAAVVSMVVTAIIIDDLRRATGMSLQIPVEEIGNHF